MRLIVCTMLSSLALVRVVGAQSLADDPDVIATLVKVAETICGEFQTSGEATSFELSGDANAELKGLLDKLANLGVTGAASFSAEKYVASIRDEKLVAANFDSVRECRKGIWNDLKSKIVSVGGVTKKIENNGGGNINIIGKNNNVSGN